MSPRPPSAPQKALTDLDHRIEAAVGRSVDALWEQCDDGLLDEPHTRLVEAHRALVQAVIGVTFHRTLLHRLTEGEFPVDQALFERIDRTVAQLEEAAGIRDERQKATVAALESVEADAPRANPAGVELSAPDFAALLAIARGAHLRQHLLTNQLSVVTASGTRIPPSVLDRAGESRARRARHLTPGHRRPAGHPHRSRTHHSDQPAPRNCGGDRARTPRRSVARHTTRPQLNPARARADRKAL
ncbi:hypothetical protein [Streptomyces niveus]|uniref:hypothetical protein n=1 Tax=Streptomyces niveus TaxID=193462 RepID=UPI001F32DA20|nr:hypothetical protein [Streptomyces niveus]